MTRSDSMEPAYELRRPELALVLDLAAGRVDRQVFINRMVVELDWMRADAAELADLLGCLLREAKQ